MYYATLDTRFIRSLDIFVFFPIINSGLGVLPLCGATGYIARLTLFFIQGLTCMYMLYADDSGSPTNKGDKYCVLAGFATRVDQNYWIQKNVDRIVAEHMGMSNLELHGSPIRSGRGVWHQIPKDQREGATQGNFKLRCQQLSQAIYSFWCSYQKSGRWYS